MPNSAAVRLLRDAPSGPSHERIARQLAAWRARDQGTGTPAPSLATLIAAEADLLPWPGDGDTLMRWAVLAEVAALDLSLVKLFEGHTDALAILQELHGPQLPRGARIGTWCAEPPFARLEIRPAASGHDAAANGRVMLNGRKAWCSGAAELTHALVSGWNPEAQPVLALVDLQQPGVSIGTAGWEAVGMAATRSVDVQFEQVAAHQVGAPGAYVSRPGFWQGGAGIAACWFGGAMGIARRVRALAGTQPDAHRLAHFGAIEVALASSAAQLREAARWIDAHPAQDAQRVALRVRLAVERDAAAVIEAAGRALGAAPLCRDAAFARAMADLPVFMRQSHAERDLAALGRHFWTEDEAAWTL